MQVRHDLCAPSLPNFTFLAGNELSETETLKVQVGQEGGSGAGRTTCDTLFQARCSMLWFFMDLRWRPGCTRRHQNVCETLAGLFCFPWPRAASFPSDPRAPRAELKLSPQLKRRFSDCDKNVRCSPPCSPLRRSNGSLGTELKFSTKTTGDRRTLTRWSLAHTESCSSNCKDSSTCRCCV